MIQADVWSEFQRRVNPASQPHPAPKTPELMEKTSSSSLCSGLRVFLCSIILPDLRFTSSIYPSCISVTSAQSQFVVGLRCTRWHHQQTKHLIMTGVCADAEDRPPDGKCWSSLSANRGSVCFRLKCCCKKNFEFDFKTTLILEFWDKISHRTGKNNVFNIWRN